VFALMLCAPLTISQAERLQALETQMAEANEEYVRAVRRASESRDLLPEYP